MLGSSSWLLSSKVKITILPNQQTKRLPESCPINTTITTLVAYINSHLACELIQGICIPPGPQNCQISFKLLAQPVHKIIHADKNGNWKNQIERRLIKRTGRQIYQSEASDQTYWETDLSISRYRETINQSNQSTNQSHRQ